MSNKITGCVSFLFLYLTFNSNAQEFNFGLQCGIGYYNMKDLKELTTHSINQQEKIVSNYPPSVYFQPSIIFKVSIISFGFLYSYHFTGSTILSKDNSGNRVDTKINCHAPGIIFGIHPENESKIRPSLYCELGRVFSNLIMDEFSAKGIQTNDGYKFIGRCLYFESGLQFSYYIKKYIIGLNGGYFNEF